MKAAVFREVNQPMEIEDVEISKPGPREVLVRTSAAGICHSDMHFWNGTYPGRVPMVLIKVTSSGSPCDRLNGSICGSPSVTSVCSQE